MADEFNPSVGSSIPKSEAEARIKKYDDQVRLDKGRDTKSVFYGKDKILDVLNQDSQIVGISFFLSLKYSESAGKDIVDVIMVGTTADGTLIWQDSADVQNAAYDSSLPCPPYCPK